MPWGQSVSLGLPGSASVPIDAGSFSLHLVCDRPAKSVPLATAHCMGTTATWNKVPKKAPISHHLQPQTLAIVIALITMSNSILRMPNRNNTSKAAAAVGLISRYTGTR